MSDAAAFNKQALQDIYGDSPQCIFSGRRANDWHHIVSRGPQKDRKLYSSVLNASPISRECHDFAPLHNPHLELFLREIAYKKVMWAVARGAYSFTPVDWKFLEQFPL